MDCEQSPHIPQIDLLQVQFSPRLVGKTIAWSVGASY